VRNQDSLAFDKRTCRPLQVLLGRASKRNIRQSFSLQQLHAGSFVNSAQMVVQQSALKAQTSKTRFVSFPVQPASLGGVNPPPLLHVANVVGNCCGTVERNYFDCGGRNQNQKVQTTHCMSS
jgi:hypothetical protein